MSRPTPLFVVDAFTSVPFGGNPAAVCFPDADWPDEIMRSVAAEMKHSETAFVRPLGESVLSTTRFGLRWFTPTVEVPLCGHATLATAAVLFGELGHPAGTLAFETASGVLEASRAGRAIVLDFPAMTTRPRSRVPDIEAALGLTGVLGTYVVGDGRNLLLQAANDADVRALAPDFARLRHARPDPHTAGVIVTAAGAAEAGGYDCVSRYFAPWIGIDEDPVTGSAHCALAPFWARLTGRNQLRAWQASARGGELGLAVEGARVKLSGEAVVIARGTLAMGSRL